MENNKVKMMSPQALIKVDIGAKFYSQLCDLYFWYVELHGHDKCIEAAKGLTQREPANDMEKHLLTIMAILVEIETKADQQGFLEDRVVGES